MSFSEWSAKIRKRYFREGEERASHTHHSTSYHTYFQGYSENKVLTGKGVGFKIERTYTAHYLSLTSNKKKWIGYKALYAFLYLIFIAADLLALFSRSQANDATWTSLFGVLALLMALMLLIPLGNYLAAPMCMKLGQYNISAKRLGQYSIPATILAELYLLLSVLWYPIMGVSPNGNDILCLVYQLLSTGAILTLCLVERRTKYHRIPNKAGLPSFQGEIW